MTRNPCAGPSKKMSEVNVDFGSGSGSRELTNVARALPREASTLLWEKQRDGTAHVEIVIQVSMLEMSQVHDEAEKKRVQGANWQDAGTHRFPP